MDAQVEVDPMLSTESSFDFDGGFGQEEFQEDVDWDDGSEGSFGSATAIEAERVAPWEYFEVGVHKGARNCIGGTYRGGWFFCVDVVETAQTASKRFNWSTVSRD